MASGDVVLEVEDCDVKQFHKAEVGSFNDAISGKWKVQLAQTALSVEHPVQLSATILGLQAGADPIFDVNKQYTIKIVEV